VRRFRLVALLAGFGIGACFSEAAGFDCNPGEGGCECNQGVCFEGLECTSGYCTRRGCTPGGEFCVCDEGMCDGDLECFEGIVCRPKKGKGDPTDAGGTETSGVSAEGTDGSATTTTGAGQTSTDGTTGDDGTGCDSACGECTTCSARGECVPDPGASCDGPTLQCADYVHGLQDGTCYALAPGEVGPACNSQGICVAATAQDCAPVQGEVIAACDATCVEAPGLCAPFAAASALDVAAFCEQDGTTADCTSTCFNGSYSQLNVKTCSGGACIMLDEIDCGGYDCVDLMCLTSCTSHIDCAMFYACDFMSGTCYLP
jgi:hypothetical protein